MWVLKFRGREVKSWKSSHENFPIECLYSGSCGFDYRLLTSPHQHNLTIYIYIYSVCVCVRVHVCVRTLHHVWQTDVTPRVRWPRRKPHRMSGRAPGRSGRSQTACSQLSLRTVNCLSATVCTESFHFSFKTVVLLQRLCKTVKWNYLPELSKPDLIVQPA